MFSWRCFALITTRRKKRLADNCVAQMKTRIRTVVSSHSTDILMLQLRDNTVSAC